jgi:pilus assembly protein Flp/PilA
LRGVWSREAIRKERITMNRNERGQGLVEYALILVLVATVVMALLLLLGEEIQGVFCDMVAALLHPVDDAVTMDIDADSLDIDVDGIAGFSIGSVVTPPSHGTVEQYNDDTFIYLRYESEVGTGADDSFTFRYECHNHNCGNAWQYDYTVVIIVGEPDLSLSVASVMSDAEQTTLELDDAREQIMILWEEAAAQEEGLQEGVDFALEAVVEGFEVLIDYADDLNQQELSAGLSLLIQNIQSGDIDGIPDAVVALGSYMEDVPWRSGPRYHWRWLRA